MTVLHPRANSETGSTVLTCVTRIGGNAVCHVSERMCACYTNDLRHQHPVIIHKSDVGLIIIVRDQTPNQLFVRPEQHL